MAVERTLSIIKPDATRRNITGAINERFESAGLRIVAQKRLRLTRERAEGFYAVHKERPFYGDLVKFMTSGPVVVSVLEGPNAIAAHRDLLGPTNSEEAPAGTIRGDFGMSKRYNLVHGSDSPEAAATEIGLFFTPEELVDYELRGMQWIYDMSTGEVI